MIKKYSLSGLFILLISLSWGQTLNFEFVESSGSCGSTTDGESNIVCFDLYAKSSGYVGDARMVSYEISFCYDETVLSYKSDGACLIDDGNDFSDADFLGEYNVGGNSTVSGPQVISDASFTLLHNICFTFSNLVDLENTIVIGACNNTMFIIPANTAQITDDEGPKSVGSFVEDSLTAINGSLPVELINFSAIPFGSKVQLNWNTATEINNKGFEIQRSTNGTYWEEIGFVSGFGSSSDRHDYIFHDRQPYDEINYYRLKQIDFNGDFEYSNVEQVDFNVDKGFNIYPNPTNGILIIEGEEIDRITIINSLGQVVKIFNAPGGLISIGEFQHGLYLLVIDAQGKSEITTVVKW